MSAHNLNACRRRKHQFLLRGFLFCALCGHRYTGELHPAKQKAYYHCTAIRTHSNRRQNADVVALEREVEERFRSIQFSENFSQQIIDLLRTDFLGKRAVTNTQRQILNNKKHAVETKRDKAEEKLLNDVITDEDFVRLRAKFTAEIAQIQHQIEELENQHHLDVSVLQEVLHLSRNIYAAYTAAPYELKRKYLGLFWDKFMIKDRKIIKAIPTDLVLALQKEQKVIIMSDWLPGPLLIRTLQNQTYMAGLKSKLQDLNLLPDEAIIPVLAA
jgi:uncharacterized Zn finger protein (UPF0148 family)